MAYLNEIREDFEKFFNGLTISVSTVYNILIHDCHFTKQKVGAPHLLTIIATEEYFLWVFELFNRDTDGGK